MLRQGALGRDSLAAPKAFACTGIRYPHEVPPSLANHGIEDRSRKILDNRPVLPDWLLDGVQSVWPDASLAQKNGMQLHARALLDIAGTSTGFKPDSIAAEGVLGTLGMGPAVDS